MANNNPAAAKSRADFGKWWLFGAVIAWLYLMWEAIKGKKT